jgi:hypothetical protein
MTTFAKLATQYRALCKADDDNAEPEVSIGDLGMEISMAPAALRLVADKDTNFDPSMTASVLEKLRVYVESSLPPAHFKSGGG